MTDSPTERRHFSRVAVSRAAELDGPTGRRAVTVEDLSLNGALLRLPDADTVEPGTTHGLVFALGDGAVIHMALTAAHQEGELAGFHCEHMDLDSISHLRRLLEHNLGDPELLHRELGELASG